MVYHIPSKVSVTKKLLQASAGTKRSHFGLRPAPIILETMALPIWVGPDMYPEQVMASSSSEDFGKSCSQPSHPSPCILLNTSLELGFSRGFKHISLYLGCFLDLGGCDYFILSI